MNDVCLRMLEPRKRVRKKSLSLFPLLKLKPSLLVAFFIGLGTGLGFHSTFDHHPWHASATQNAHIRACFSPNGHCTDNIVAAIRSAQSSIRVMAFSFTSPEIAEALVEAHSRGIDVKILMDKSQRKDKYSKLPFLLKSGIPTLIDPAAGIAHNKVIIVDDRFVLTGSFNFTRAAESKNAENVLLIDDPSLAKIYKDNWDKRALDAKQIGKRKHS